MDKKVGFPANHVKMIKKEQNLVVVKMLLKEQNKDVGQLVLHVKLIKGGKADGLARNIKSALWDT